MPHWQSRDLISTNFTHIINHCSSHFPSIPMEIIHCRFSLIQYQQNDLVGSLSQPLKEDFFFLKDIFSACAHTFGKWECLPTHKLWNELPFPETCALTSCLVMASYSMSQRKLLSTIPPPSILVSPLEAGEKKDMQLIFKRKVLPDFYLSRWGGGVSSSRQSWTELFMEGEKNAMVLLILIKASGKFVWKGV